MARVRRFIDVDVLTEARRRVAHIYDIFDSVVVFFSGGKDSLVCLHLCYEEAKKRGRLPLDVVHHDHEFVSPVVEDFTADHAKLPWIKMNWFCYRTAGTINIGGTAFDCSRWDPSRPFLRTPPPFAVFDNDFIYTKMQIDEKVSMLYKGKVAYVMGIRAVESLARYRSVINKLNDNYINAPVGTNATGKYKICKPIFDWLENDIFKFLWENKIAYCPYYDYELWSGDQMRVAGCLHAEAMKKIDKLMVQDAVMFQRIVDFIPEVAVHVRYGNDFNEEKDLYNYGYSFAGVERWAREKIPDRNILAKVLQKINSAKICYAKSPEAYPPAYILKQFLIGSGQGSHIGTLLPLDNNEQTNWARRQAAINEAREKKRNERAH